MTLHMLKQLSLLLLLSSFSTSIKAEDPPSILNITATLGGTTTYVIRKDSNETVRAISSSMVIQQSLLPALLSGAVKVKVELTPGSNAIKRVNAYDLGEGTLLGVMPSFPESPRSDPPMAGMNISKSSSS